MQRPHDSQHASAPAIPPPQSMSWTLNNREIHLRNDKLWSRVASFALLISIAAVPYVLLRRNFRQVNTTLRRANEDTAALQKKVSFLTAQVAAHREESRKFAAAFQEAHEHIRWLRARREERDIARVDSDALLQSELKGLRQELEQLQREVLQKERARTRSEEACSSQLQTLLQEKEWTREHISPLRALGVSLADIAAFMHETELALGYRPRTDDGRGIEKIRQLALKIQKLPPPPLEDVEQSKPKLVSNQK